MEINKITKGEIHKRYVFLSKPGLYKTEFPNLAAICCLISLSVLPSLISSIIFSLISTETGALELANDPLVHLGHLISLIRL